MFYKKGMCTFGGCSFAHCKELHGKPTPPSKMKLAPLKMQGAYGQGQPGLSDNSDKSNVASPRQDAAQGNGKPGAKPGAKATAKAMCIIPAKTAATLTLLAATASSVLDPANAIRFYESDVCLHVPVSEYSNITALNVSYLDNRDDLNQVFREATFSPLVV